MTENGQNTSTEGKTDAANAGQSLPGNGVKVSRKERLTYGQYYPGNKAIDAKATRAIAAQFGVGAKELEALGITWTFLAIRNKEGAALDHVVKWSGHRSNWQYRIRTGIEKCIELGCIEWVKAFNGYAIAITAKGQRILDFYDRIAGEIMDRERKELPAKYVRIYKPKGNRVQAVQDNTQPV